MNSYDKRFFKQYINEGNEVLEIAHQHILVILSKIFVNFVIYVSIPTFLYYSSDKIKNLIPFFVFEIYLIFLFLKICYDILNWYNDVWIITKDGLIDLERSLFNSVTQSLKFENIEGIEIVQDGFFDTILGKGEIIANKIGGEGFILKNAANIYNISEKIDKASSEINSENEEFNDEFLEENNNYSNYNEEKLDKLIEVLSGVIEGQMGKKQKEFKEEEVQEVIQKVKKEKGTIDLR
ncbi:MAG: hypothetical protein NWP80_00640 [Candidatus Gracilibacteria bacterium]|nr:hypothetical protein [Candidatus Gracilibacteria bacterium]